MRLRPIGSLKKMAAARAMESGVACKSAVCCQCSACLLRPNETRNEAEQSPHESRVINPPETERDQELELLIRAAQADCDAGQREDQTRVLRLERALGVLQARLALLNQKLAMVLGVHVKDAKKEVHSVLRAHASVDVALDRNALIQDLNTLTSELDMARSKQYRARLMRIGHLSTDVALKITQKAVLETYLENPRLTVPQSGHVSRIRPVPVGTRFDTEETIIEIQGSEAEQFVADLRVPLAQVSILPVGTQVTVSLAGFTENGPILNGAIEYWAQADTEAGIDYAVARIGLAKESQKLLANPRNGIALRGTSTASVIRAQLEPKTLQATLIDSISNKSEWVRSLLSLGAFGAKSTQHPL